ncbi:M23 family metallopeptidase, partial [Bacillus licheniformis]|uniref:M23 family metallopeptidase n=1 Tax=Bacillus licheniformis TaxID=1402 RepID=UPI00227DE76D
NNTYSMSKGIDLAEKDGKTFDVSASISGTVIKAAKDPVLGYVVEVEHEDGLSTVYQSLSEVSVKQGDKIEQNQVIGKAGKNLYNEEGGNHVPFEIRKDGVALNPLNFMDKPVSSIEKAMEEQASEVKEPAQPSVEEKSKTEDKAKDQTDGKDDKTKREDSSEGSENQDGTQSDDSSQS